MSKAHCVHPWLAKHVDVQVIVWHTTEEITENSPAVFQTLFNVRGIKVHVKT